MTTNAGRATSTAGRLAKRGFADPARAERLLASPPIALISDDDRLLESLGHAADPDLALGGLARLAESAKDPAELMGSVVNHERLRTRLIGVLGTSAALGDHLARHPEHWRELVDDSVDLSRPTSSALRTLMLEAVGANPLVSEPIATNAQALDALRVEYRRLLLGLAARDLSGAVAVEDVAGELADLAGATLDAALAVARADLPPDAAPVRLAVIALGKCGGRELNYVSDVDVVYVAEPLEGQDEAAALRTGNQLAAALARACSATTSEGTIWPVDAALRPEGKAGPLVRTLASHLGVPSTFESPPRGGRSRARAGVHRRAHANGVACGRSCALRR